MRNKSGFILELLTYLTLCFLLIAGVSVELYKHFAGDKVDVSAILGKITPKTEPAIEAEKDWQEEAPTGYWKLSWKEKEGEVRPQ
ncbi:MAG: hypothetical protein HY226_01590, partial [Candidatus Vogelbacteria bacterium]|nr:hypothetical protein [Candidatus Vogelbacteria bacterium]